MGTKIPGTPVNTSATKNGWDKKRWILRARVTVSRARKIQRFLSQPFNVGEVFTGLKGVTVPVAETVESFEALVKGDLDEVPEQAFLNVGGAESVLEKARSLEGGDS
ncbi:MAG TPA: hypothetical protein VHX40_01015 [Acidimicrobiales bacterium]|nr:hypothetical protein [Acidimicrobiales bacterium]